MCVKMVSMKILDKIFGSSSERFVRQIKPLVEDINAFQPAIRNLSDAELKAKTTEFKSRLAAGEKLDDILPEAFAVCREASFRTLGQRHYDVQLLGGIVLHQGKIAEMKTGEGKTLVATLPVYLNALTGRGVHVVTVNDYLSRRDAEWMGQIYSFLGLSVGVVAGSGAYLYEPQTGELDAIRDAEGGVKVLPEFLKPCTKRDAYACDITYGTNNEFGFDYLRDNIAYHKDNVSQRANLEMRRPYFAIVDEVDSILIDESRTPLIISAPQNRGENLYDKFAAIARTLNEGEDYKVELKNKAIQLTETGIDKAEKALSVDNIYTEGGIKYVHHLETAVRAKALYHKDKEYVVKDGEIVIVDDFTGRLMPGRRWSEGLHQAVEAKEGVQIKEESRTMATITFQNLFRLYEKLAGMTGTGLTSQEEFHKVYGLDVIAIPTHRPVLRQDLPDQIFKNETGKMQALARKVKDLHQKGLPVLIGTVSIEKNELLSAYLKKEGIPHQILNAKNHEQEGVIIADAGKKGSVVVATNMAGRGVDIKLGGTHATDEERQAIRDLGGLAVIGTERHEARRIDNQLRGRSGRQGDPGFTQFFISFEDTLMRIFPSERAINILNRLGIADDEAIQNSVMSNTIERAQEKIEGLNFDMRKHLLDYDDVMNTQRTVMYDRRRKILFGANEEVVEILDSVLKPLIEIDQDGQVNDPNLDIINKKRAEVGDEVFYREIRVAMLQLMDMLWVDQLEAMDYLRSSVRLRAYGQRDPLVEYKKEGLKLFRELEWTLANQLAAILPNIGVGFKEEKPVLSVVEVKEAVAAFSKPSEESGEAAAKTALSAVALSMPKVGRNDPCPCGSGKKYKKCHGS